jgi:hypothetical protein
LSRLAPLDKALVLILVPLWLICFSLGVRSVVRGGAHHAGLGLSVEDADSYPVLTGDFNPVAHPSDPLTQAGLLPGDRLVRMGDADLRGVGTLRFSARSIEEARPDASVTLVFERDGARLETSLALVPVSTRRPQLAAAFALAASALLLLLRGQPTPMVRAYFYFAMCWAFMFAFHQTRREFYAWFAIFVAASSLYFPLAFRFLHRFPDDRPPGGRWHRIWPWFFSVQGLFVGLAFSSRMAIGEMGFGMTAGLGAVAAVGVATRKYRRADLVARRQMKWVLFGVYCVALPLGVAIALPPIDPRFGWLWYPGFWLVPLIPLSLLVSVVRFNLFDIDRLLSATASYNVLAVLLGGGALIVVPRLAEAVSEFAGVDPRTGQVVLSLVLAAVLIPAHRRLRPQIDRLFFKERYALDHGIADLLPTLSDCNDARELTECAGSGLYGLLRPEACVVYATVEQSYAPVFVQGRAVPPAFETDSPLIGTLRERRAPLSLSAAGRRPDEAPLGPFDRAALETLQAEVVVPVRQDEALAAFLCLGPKRSGDVYTSTDLSLLAAVAEKVATELRRFDQEQTVREAREMQESLRRYVPGAVVEQLSSGATLTSGERYTETASQIVQKHAGSVVEFNGDGMMAVFGAPRELAHKERAALKAGREIVEAVGSLTVDDAQGRPTKLSVGVGIATGEAFVGNIRAVDRLAALRLVVVVAAPGRRVRGVDPAQPRGGLLP